MTLAALAETASISLQNGLDQARFGGIARRDLLAHWQDAFAQVGIDLGNTYSEALTKLDRLAGPRKVA